MVLSATGEDTAENSEQAPIRSRLRETGAVLERKATRRDFRKKRYSRQQLQKEISETILDIERSSSLTEADSSKAFSALASCANQVNSFQKKIKAGRNHSGEAVEPENKMNGVIKDHKSGAKPRRGTYLSRVHHEKIKKEKEMNRGIVPKILNNSWFKAAQILLTIFALFASDFGVAACPPSSYFYIEILLIFVMIFFVIEAGLRWQGEEGYAYSFYFWMDVVATVSILADLSLIIQMLFAETDQQEERFVILRVGKVVRTGARTTRTLRILRVLRFARLLRTIRLINFAKRAHENKILANTQDGEEDPSKLGLKLADMLGKRVVLMIIVLLFSLPQLEVQVVDAAIPNGLEILEDLLDANGTTSFGTNFNTTDFILLNPDKVDRVFVPSLSIALEGFKKGNKEVIELVLDKWVVASSDLIESVPMQQHFVFWQTVSGRSYAVQNMYESSVWQAFYDILLNLLLIFILGVSGYLFTMDVNKSVVIPIVRTTKALKKLAHTLFILTTDASAEDAMNDENMNALEESFVDSVVNKLTVFFSVDKPHAKLNDGKTDPDRPRRQTAKTHPREEESHAVQNLSAPYGRGQRVASPRELIPNSRVHCLDTLEACFLDSQSLQFFKVFLTSELSVDTLVFIQMADFFSEVKTEADEIATEIKNSYVLADETNYNERDFAMPRDEKNRIALIDPEDFKKSTLQVSRDVAFNKLQRDNFPRFRASPLAEELISIKKKQLKEYQMLKDQFEKQEQQRQAEVNRPKLSKALTKFLTRTNIFSAKQERKSD